MARPVSDFYQILQRNAELKIQIVKWMHTKTLASPKALAKWVDKKLLNKK